MRGQSTGFVHLRAAPALKNLGKAKMLENDAKKILTLERRDEATFVGRSIQFDTSVIFGGQLLAQALFAAANTLPETRPASALHAHFLNYGDPDKELEFHVRALKDGKSTNNRQVEVMQSDRLLMLATISFHQPGDGYDFFSTMPDTTRPEHLARENNIRFGLSADEGAFPFSMVGVPDTADEEANTSSIWVKSLLSAGGDTLWQQMLFAFVSDATILQSALRPHGLVFGDPKLVVATMNHTIWFHRGIDIEEWVLIHSKCISTGGGRALSSANAFDSAGVLVATTSQEGVLKTR